MTRRSRCLGAVALVAAAVTVGPRWAAASEPADEPVDVFAAQEAEQIEVQAFARNARRANLVIKNKTNRPLTVAVPSAVAVVPALAQQVGQFDWPELGLDQRESPQRVGVGPFGHDGRQQQQGPFGDFFNPVDFNALFSIPPEKVVRVGMLGVCLDHGLPEPNARMPVKVVPVDQASSVPEVAALVRMVAARRVRHTVGQLAAWHLQNGISWKELRAERTPATIGFVPRYSRNEIRSAKKLVERLRAAAKKLDSPDTQAVTSSR